MSSNHRLSLPLYILTYASLRIMFRALPIWSGPDGNGARRMTTCPSVAFSSSFSPVLIFRLDVWMFELSNCSFCSSRDSALTSLMICWIVGIVFWTSDFCRPSEKREDRTAPWDASPLYLIAFSRA